MEINGWRISKEERMHVFVMDGEEHWWNLNKTMDTYFEMRNMNLFDVSGKMHGDDEQLHTDRTAFAPPATMVETRH